jgi:hypothetical protein
MGLVHHLHFVEQTLKYDPINFLDFCTQLRSRMINDSLNKFLPDLCFENLSRQENFALCYFEGFHHSLRENARIDLVTKLPGCQILATKFFSDKHRVLLSLSNGLLIIMSMTDYSVEKVMVCKSAVFDQVKLVDDRYVACSGIDSHVRIWSIDKE